MVARALLIPLLAVAIALPAAPAALAGGGDGAPAAVAAKKKCKKGKVRRGGKCVKKKGKKVTPTPTPPAPPAPTSPPPEVPQQPGVQFTPDDAAARQALANGLFLERSDWGSVTATYYRLFFYPDGVFKSYVVDWNQVSGEICTTKNVGTWSVHSGYRFDARGGGLVAVVNINAGSINGTEILAASNQDSSHVYVGRNEQQWDINPNMRDSC